MSSPPAKKFKLQGSLQFQGLSVAVENKPGSVRKGVGKDGKPWRTEMKHHYGYLRGTEGADGEEVDAYVGPDRKAPDAYVVHQRREDGTGFDEDKVMLGFGSKDEAERAFLAHYDDPKFLGPVSTIPVERLKEKVEAGGTLKKISSDVVHTNDRRVIGALMKPGDILLTRVRDPRGIASQAFAKILEVAQDTPYYHSAMYVGDDKVVHSRIGEGVTSMSLPRFQRRYDYQVLRVRAPEEERDTAAQHVKGMVGREYSMRKLLSTVWPTRESRRSSVSESARDAQEFVCSELVAAAYPKRVFGGRAIESTRPVDFSRSPNTQLVAEYRGGAPDMKKAAEEQGWWRGDPMSPGGVKFKTTFQGIPVHVDRPKGFIMLGRDAKGVPWARKYRYDYGFIPRTKGGDGDGLDVFLGPNKKARESYWAIQRKPDGSFDEYKVFLGFDNRDEAVAAYRQHIPKKLLGGFVAVKVDMLKAMLGMNAEGYQSGAATKTAQFIGCLDELEKIGGVDAR